MKQNIKRVKLKKGKEKTGSAPPTEYNDTTLLKIKTNGSDYLCRSKARHLIISLKIPRNTFQSSSRRKTRKSREIPSSKRRQRSSHVRARPQSCHVRLRPAPILLQKVEKEASGRFWCILPDSDLYTFSFLPFTPTFFPSSSKRDLFRAR